MRTDQTGVPEGYKRCASCREVKKKHADSKQSEFYKNCEGWDGYLSRCKSCYGKARPEYERDRTHEYKKTRIRNGYTVVDGCGWLENGSHLDYWDVHANYTPISFADGTVLRRNRDGKKFEVWNKAKLVEVDG